ncbi:MAG TPA: hypothetical protein VGD69_16340 [Herpetosiphonaceae bacterium]
MAFRPSLFGHRPTRPLVSALILGLALSATALGQSASAIQLQAAPSPAPDLGDAPASTNNFGVGMQWTPISPFNAQFPTVFFAGVQPTGPKHFNNPTLFYLANQAGTITQENQADSGADADGVNNIRPPANIADQDKGDDGPDWASLGAIAGCGPKQYRYWVTVLPGAPTTAYVNSWYDFNQSGRWGDIFACGSLNVDEWIVKNQVITFPGPGIYAFSTPVFNAAPKPTGNSNPRWLRISLSESPLPNTTPARIGSGPAQGWKYGETEDFRLSN